MRFGACRPYSIVATAAHLGSILIATSNCRKRKSISRPTELQTALGRTRIDALSAPNRTSLQRARGIARTRAPSDAAGVSLVRPVCGMENHIEETLRSAFDLDYPRYEIVFCAAAATTPPCRSFGA